MASVRISPPPVKSRGRSRGPDPVVLRYVAFWQDVADMVRRLADAIPRDLPEAEAKAARTAIENADAHLAAGRPKLND